MMDYATLYQDREMVRVMGDAFDAHLKARLRERIIAAIEPELNAAIAEAMKSFEMVIQRHRDVSMDRTIVSVILDDRRGKA